MTSYKPIELSKTHTHDRVMILGASGFMGQFLCRAISETGRNLLKPNRTEYAISELESLASLITNHNPDAIINLAAISSVTHDNLDEIYQTNAFGHLRLLEAAKSVGFAGPILLASSANVYGQNQSAQFCETDAPMPLNHYGVSKTMAEYYNRFFQYELDVAAARPFNCIGAGQSDAFVMGKIVAAFARRDHTLQLGNLNVRRDYVDIRDIADMWIAFLECPSRPKLVNFGSGRSVSLSDVIEHCASITGHNIELKVSDSLKRPNDIAYQCGDLSILRTFWESPLRSLEETLVWMLERSSQEYKL